MALKQEMFVKTDAEENNNKFWEITLLEDGAVITRNGRVGSKGQTRTIGSGERLYASKIREKLRHDYRPVPVIGAPERGVVADVGKVAEEQIAAGCPIVAELVRGLARINRHQILTATGGQMDVDLTTGIIRTPVGVVSRENVDAARARLPVLGEFVRRRDFDSPGFIGALNEYLMLVPQKVDSRRGWHRDLLPDGAAIVRQNALLDQLEASIDLARDRAAQAASGPGSAPVFDARMSVLEGAEADRIARLYTKTINAHHTCAHLRPKRFFEVEIGPMSRAWEEDGARLDNRMELWHGTRAHNLLSILKSGLVIPRRGGSVQITGRMFGDGLYFSDQSTKALNYAYGYWDRGGRDQRCYMFLADVGMGRSYKPSASFSGTPPDGYDSTFVRGGTANVKNNEMIVYRTGQARMRHLVEFG